MGFVTSAPQAAGGADAALAVGYVRVEAAMVLHRYGRAARPAHARARPGAVELHVLVRSPSSAHYRPATATAAVLSLC